MGGLRKDLLAYIRAMRAAKRAEEKAMHRLYREGDPDPTWSTCEALGIVRGEVWDESRVCLAEGAPEDAKALGLFYRCTWPKGHEHPQHVAGGMESVAFVWPVENEPVYEVPEPYVIYSKGDDEPTRAACISQGIYNPVTGDVDLDRVCLAELGYDHSFPLANLFDIKIVCSWPKGHTHPQHVAGGSDGKVKEAWPVGLEGFLDDFEYEPGHVFAVGEPDPNRFDTDESSPPPCNQMSWRGLPHDKVMALAKALGVDPIETGFWHCTRRKGHTEPQHVAGDGERVCFVWNEGEAVPMPADLQQDRWTMTPERQKWNEDFAASCPTDQLTKHADAFEHMAEAHAESTAEADFYRMLGTIAQRELQRRQA